MAVKRVAVVLSGCGKMDGSEVQEAAAILFHLSRHGASVRCFAPEAPQADVINHATNKPTIGGTRNMLVEAARISRGDITPLEKLNPAEFDALCMPGGYGAAKNLCDFAVKGTECTVLPDVERVVKGFHGAKKPIAMCCIAPVIAARVLGTRGGGPGCRVTIGTDAATAAAVATMGAANIAKGVTEIFIDEPNRLITTPAYMYEATPFEVYQGIGLMIDALMK